MSGSAVLLKQQQHLSLRPASCRKQSRSRTALRSAVPGAPASTGPNGTSSQAKDTYFINEIPKSQWPNGIPPVMGAHLMASGTVAPISTSKGAGMDIIPHVFQYADNDVNISVQLYVTAAAASAGLTKAVVEAAAAAIKAKGTFTLVLSGGSLLNSLAALASQKGVEWDKWHIFFADERNVPHDSPDSNYKGAVDAFLGKVPIPAANIHAIAENLPVAAAAVNYEGRLLGLPTSVLPRTADNFPIFDQILLGIGPDGHVASLFPNKAETAATSGWVLPVSNSPKPPPERITLTLPAINAAKDIVVVALGEGKAEVVQRVLEVQALPGALPAQLVRPTEGRVRWLLDVAAAQHLDIASWDNTKLFPRSQ